MAGNFEPGDRLDAIIIGEKGYSKRSLFSLAEQSEALEDPTEHILNFDGGVDQSLIQDFQNSIMLLRQQLVQVQKENSKLKFDENERNSTKSMKIQQTIPRTLDDTVTAEDPDEENLHSAIIIQRSFRSQSARSSFIKLKRSVTTIQARYRGARDRKAYCQKQCAAIIIQSFVRMLIRRMEFLLQLECLGEENYQYR